VQRSQAAEQLRELGHGIGEGIKLGVGLASPLAGGIHAASEGDVVGTALAGAPIVGKLASKTTEAARKITTVVADVRVISRGVEIARGNRYLGEALDAIKVGKLAARNVYQNVEGYFPAKPFGYYEEFYIATPGRSKTGPERIIRGKGGEFWYSPDHYVTPPIPLD
jgi:guanyl-specific ribonuclease Sa